MLDCNPSSIPIEAKATAATFEKGNHFNGPYRELVGSLLYLAYVSRPDILFAVNCLSQLQEHPTDAAWCALKKILRYLKGTAKMKINYKKCNLYDSDLSLYVDADWGSNSNDRKSISGYLIMFCNNPILWCVNKQKCIALSSTEAEIIALSKGVQDLLWIKGIASEIVCVKNLIVYEDNQSCIKCWLSELEISSFDKLKELIIADQIKKKCPPEYKNHYLDIWETLNDPVTLPEKLDLYENIKSPYQKVIKSPKSQEWYKPKFPRNAGSQNLKNSQFTKFEKTDSSSTHKNTISNSSNMPSRNVDNSVYCYGCGYPGFIKSKCPKCSPKKDGAHVNAIQVFTCFTLPVALLDIEVYEATGTVCADTGARQSVGGELMFNFLQKRGQKFIEIDLAVCLADGQQSTSTVLKTTVPITIHGRTFRTNLIFLPHAKGNRILLGVDFFKAIGNCDGHA
ncbi:Copia protein [Araneus ventricosus]|uniref:Copia protein n=1 Tax=Araneus ventricosus TaxID=182803 RepID=A0A4Y2KXY7_ARAVE|nr:Copia protein [Araneus ventricosus]